MVGLKAILLAAKVCCDLVEGTAWLRHWKDQVSEYSWGHTELSGGVDSEVVTLFHDTVELTEGGIKLCNLFVTDFEVGSEVDGYLQNRWGDKSGELDIEGS